MRQCAETWSELSIRPTAMLDDGRELIVLVLMRARGIDSSVETSLESPQAVRLVAGDGRVIEQRIFISRETAVAAGLGLP